MLLTVLLLSHPYLAFPFLTHWLLIKIHWKVSVLLGHILRQLLSVYLPSVACYSYHTNPHCSLHSPCQCTRSTKGCEVWRDLAMVAYPPHCEPGCCSLRACVFVCWWYFTALWTVASLQQSVNVRVQYGRLCDILSNLSKLQSITFGDNCSTSFKITSDNVELNTVKKLKEFGDVTSMTDQVAWYQLWYSQV